MLTRGLQLRGLGSPSCQGTSRSAHTPKGALGYPLRWRHSSVLCLMIHRSATRGINGQPYRMPGVVGRRGSTPRLTAGGGEQALWGGACWALSAPLTRTQGRRSVAFYSEEGPVSHATLDYCARCCTPEKPHPSPVTFIHVWRQVVRKTSDSNVKMVKNDKGLWVKVRVDEPPASSGRGRGRGESAPQLSGIYFYEIFYFAHFESSPSPSL